MNRYLSFQRLGRLLLKDLREDYRAILIALGALTGVLLLNYVLNGLSGANNTPVAVQGGFTFSSSNSVLHMTYFRLTLFLGGFIITSRSFLELHTKNRGHDWLMLPASQIEKYLSRLVLTSVGVAVGVVIFYFLFSLVGNGLMLLLFRRAFSLFNPFDATVWLLVLHYIVLQSIFFAGAVYFKKLHFIKTVLVLTAFGFVMVLLIAGITRILFWKEFLALSTNGSFAHFDFQMIQARLQSAGRTAALVSRIIYWALLAPVLWVFAYFRLREAEVRNGV